MVYMFYKYFSNAVFEILLLRLYIELFDEYIWYGIMSCDLVVLKHLHLPYAVVTDHGLPYARCRRGYSYCTGFTCTVHYGI